MSYKPKPLPALSLKAERQVGDELLRISRELQRGGGGGSAADISYDNSGSGLNADNVQGAIDEVVDLIDTGGWGGVYVDESGGTSMTIPASGAWMNVIMAAASPMEGGRNVVQQSDGSLRIEDIQAIRHVTVHAALYADAGGQADLTAAVKMRILVLPSGSSLRSTGGYSREKWTTSNDLSGNPTEFFVTLNLSRVLGAIDGVLEFPYAKFYLQISQTGGSSVLVRMRNLEFWLEYS